MAAETQGTGNTDALQSGRGDELSQGPGHIPVLLDEVVDRLSPRPGGKIYDGTVGLGGHAAALVPRLGSGGQLVGVDRDAEALELARARLAKVGPQFYLFRGLYTQIDEALSGAGLDPRGGLDGILLDLGVSSLQLDAARRGFSFRRDGPLDMRMAPEVGVSAATWLEQVPVDELADVFRRYGEEPAARKIARAIDLERRTRPLRTTAELAAVVESVKPRRGRRIHPATRVFQAIRIAVNSELEHLRAFLETVDRYLAPRGRLVVVSYHSLEDRIVKELVKRRVREGIFENPRPAWLRPSQDEIGKNPRARSARLRWVVRAG